jgi:hypothetical protein
MRLRCVRGALLHTTMFAGIVGSVYLFALQARAADMALKSPLADPDQTASQPAVDGVNGKVDGLGGTLGSRSIYGSQGSISFPLATQWGVQIDGMAGSYAGQAFEDVGGHLFWRNPMQGLIGLYASDTYWGQFGGVHVSHVAGEAEGYFGRWTLQGIAGVEFGNSVTSSSTGVTVVPPGVGIPGSITTTTSFQTYDVGTRFFDQVNLKYYMTDGWDGYIGHRYLGGKNALALGTEYALPLSGRLMATAFVEGRVGEGQFNGIWGGLRFYLGQKDKSLMARQRQDDPNNWEVDNLFGIVNNYSQGTLQSTTTTAPLPTPPPI